MKEMKITESQLRQWIDAVTTGDMSFSRMVELINDKISVYEPDDKEIYSQANSYAMSVLAINTTFEDGFYTGAKWALNRDK